MDYAAKFANNNVLIKEPETFNRKISDMLKSGADQLLCVFDFDATISKSKHNGKPAATCHNALEKTLGDKSCSVLTELRDKYIKIEFDTSLTKEEKTPHMITWWTTAHKMIIAGHVNITTIKQSVKDSNIHIRDGEKEFFELLQSLPILLFSAGISQIVEYAMDSKSSAGITSNMDIVSNKMSFDENYNVVDFSHPLIHTFTKNTHSIGEKWRKKLHERKNVLLMGDSEGDPDMVRDQDVIDSGSCLRIGFLNRDSEGGREKYQELYDIVIVTNETLEVPINIVKCILSKP